MSDCKFVLDRLAQPNTSLNSEDLSPNQKKLLYEVMMRHEASQGFAYDRFFKEGFRKWELMGVEQVKEVFLGNHADEIGSVENGGDLGFYDLLGRARLKLVFIEYMSSLGMGANTVYERFGRAGETDFRNYERVGIREVVREFFREAEEKEVV